MVSGVPRQIRKPIRQSVPTTRNLAQLPAQCRARDVVGGTTSPSAFAVFKLTIGMELVGRMTGRMGNIRAHGTGNAPHGAIKSVANLAMGREIVGHPGYQGQARRYSSRRRRQRRLDAYGIGPRGIMPR